MIKNCQGVILELLEIVDALVNVLQRVRQILEFILIHIETKYSVVYLNTQSKSTFINFFFKKRSMVHILRGLKFR